MADIKKGDLVARKSYDKDIAFVVINIIEESDSEDTCIIKGLNSRLLADSPISDLVKICNDDMENCKKAILETGKIGLNKVHKRHIADEHDWKTKKRIKSNKQFTKVPGKVLHIDGDETYLNDCLEFYQKMNIKAVGHHISEQRQPLVISRLLRQYLPDILVLTGHDGLLRNKQDINKLDTYRTSKYFIRAVKIARKYEPDKDSLVIFAGACQSFYEAIMEAGANFASAPRRILINCFDPVFIVERIANTPIDTVVDLEDVIKSSITGSDGVGGIETQGRLRLTFPKKASD